MEALRGAGQQQPFQLAQGRSPKTWVSLSSRGLGLALGTGSGKKRPQEGHVGVQEGPPGPPP